MKNFTLFLTFLLVVAVSMTFASPEPSPWNDATATLMKREDYATESDSSHQKRTNAQITFYGGEDLKHAACYGRSGMKVYNAKPSDMIGAMFMKGLESCYKCLEIRNGKAKVKTIIVKIIDKCAGCPKGAKNVDLTLGAFKKLAKPIDGRVAIQWRGLPSCPKTGTWPTYEVRNKKRRN